MSMANNLVFYTNPMSRGRIVRWMLEEVGEPYETELLEYGTTMKAPAYLAINPMGKVPALRHGDTVVTESAAICAYLADAFPAAKLAPPPGDRDRGPYYRWLFFAAGPLEAAVINNFLGVEVPPDKKPMVGYGCLAEVLDTVEQAVKDREYLAGNRFSAADLYVGAHLGWGMQFGTVEKRKAFECYYDNLAKRPASKRAWQIDEALLPARPPGRPAA
jgi:glutathione S-transferase